MGGGVDAASEHADDVLTGIGARSAAQMAAENFPVAMRLLPARARADLSRIYVYARFVDDVGDEAPGDRVALLDAVQADVQALPERARLPAVAGMAPLVRRGMPLDPMLSLITANRVDQQTVRYETFDDLLRYCTLSADPVGAMVLYAAGAATERNLADSGRVCSALQVLEHCQDVGEDARAGRVYLPSCELRAADIDLAALLGSQTPPALRAIVRTQVSRARNMLLEGSPLVGRLRGWARVAVAGFVAGGLATADALEAADADVLSSLVRPSRARTARHAVRLLLRGSR